MEPSPSELSKWGPFQWRLFGLLFPIFFQGACVVFEFEFIAVVPNARCRHDTVRTDRQNSSGHLDTDYADPKYFNALIRERYYGPPMLQRGSTMHCSRCLGDIDHEEAKSRIGQSTGPSTTDGSLNLPGPTRTSPLPPLSNTVSLLSPTKPACKAEQATECDISEMLFDGSNYASTLVEDFGMVCSGGAWKRQIIGSMTMIGQLIGSVVFGWASDRWGRRNSVRFCITALIGTLAGLYVAPNAPVLSVLAVINAALMHGAYMISYLLVVEFSSPGLAQTAAGVAVHGVYTLGYSYIVGVAFMVREWRWIHALAMAPLLACLPAAYIIPESYRWLVSSQRVADAAKIMQEVTRVNGWGSWTKGGPGKKKTDIEKVVKIAETAVDKDTLLSETPSSNDVETPAPRESSSATSMALLLPESSNIKPSGTVNEGANNYVIDHITAKTEDDPIPNGHQSLVRELLPNSQPQSIDVESIPETIPSSKCAYFRLILLSIIVFYGWLSSSLLFFGISMNMSDLPGNIYVNYLLCGLVEIPGYVLVIYMFERLGRKPTMIVMFIIGGGVTVICPFISRAGYAMTSVGLAIGGKMCAAAIFAGIFNVTSEIFHTGVRGRMIGIGSAFARVGGALAVQLAMLGTYVEPTLPFVIFGIITAIGGLGMFFIPETRGQRLPQTIAETLLLASGATLRPIEPIIRSPVDPEDIRVVTCSAREKDEANGVKF